MARSPNHSTDQRVAEAWSVASAPPLNVPSISVIVPVYNEEANIADLTDSILNSFLVLNTSYEVLLVDDGSTDRTDGQIREMAGKYPQIRGVFLARNYGQSTALQAGFDEAKGKIIVTLDGDLQNDPGDIPMMLELLNSSGADLISGWRKERKDGIVRTILSNVANIIISWVTGVRLRDYGCSLKVYRRNILDRTRLFGELHRFLPALIEEAGGKVLEVPVQHHPRTRGVSKYKLDRALRVTLDLLLVVFLKRYMQRPLHLFGGVGILLSIVGTVSIGYLVILKFLFGAAIAERPLLLLGVMSLLLGVTMVGQGLIGELLSRTYFATRDHRQYHLRDGTPGDATPSTRID